MIVKVQLQLFPPTNKTVMITDANGTLCQITPVGPYQHWFGKYEVKFYAQAAVRQGRVYLLRKTSAQDW